MFTSLSSFDSDLFDAFRRMESEMDHYLNAGVGASGIRTMGRGAYPPINVGIVPEQVEVYLFAPGVDHKTLEITLHQNLLTLKGERRLMREEGAEYYRQERFSGDFYRAVNLPEDCDPEQVDAHYEAGVLHITIGRRESVKPRQIEVN